MCGLARMPAVPLKTVDDMLFSLAMQFSPKLTCRNYHTHVPHYHTPYACLMRQISIAQVHALCTHIRALIIRIDRFHHSAFGNEKGKRWIHLQKNIIPPAIAKDIIHVRVFRCGNGRYASRLEMTKVHYTTSCACEFPFRFQSQKLKTVFLCFHSNW